MAKTKKLSDEQQASLNEVARCTYLAETASKEKKAETKTDVHKKCIIDFKDELDGGVPVSFVVDGETIHGTLKAVYKKNWEVTLDARR